MIPCKDCITLAHCVAYLDQRQSEFNKDDENINLSCEEYNSESIWALFLKCSILSDYLPSSLSGFSDCFYNLSRDPTSNVPMGVWSSRYYAVIMFYNNFWVDELLIRKE